MGNLCKHELRFSGKYNCFNFRRTCLTKIHFIKAQYADLPRTEYNPAGVNCRQTEKNSPPGVFFIVTDTKGSGIFSFFWFFLYWSVSEGEHYFSCIMSWELIGSRCSMVIHSPVLIFNSKSRQQWTRYNMTEHCVCQFTFLEYIQTLFKSVSIVPLVC